MMNYELQSGGHGAGFVLSRLAGSQMTRRMRHAQVNATLEFADIPLCGTCSPPAQPMVLNCGENVYAVKGILLR